MKEALSRELEEGALAEEMRRAREVYEEFVGR